MGMMALTTTIAKINFQLIKQWQTDLCYFFVIKQLDILVPK